MQPIVQSKVNVMKTVSKFYLNDFASQFGTQYTGADRKTELFTIVDFGYSIGSHLIKYTQKLL